MCTCDVETGDAWNGASALTASALLRRDQIVGDGLVPAVVYRVFKMCVKGAILDVRYKVTGKGRFGLCLWGEDGTQAVVFDIGGPSERDWRSLEVDVGKVLGAAQVTAMGVVLSLSGGADLRGTFAPEVTGWDAGSTTADAPLNGVLVEGWESVGCRVGQIRIHDASVSIPLNSPAPAIRVANIVSVECGPTRTVHCTVLWEETAGTERYEVFVDGNWAGFAHASSFRLSGLIMEIGKTIISVGIVGYDRLGRICVDARGDVELWS